MAYSFDETLEKESNKYSSGGNYFKINEGNENVIRILSKGEAYASHYINGKFRTLYGRENGDPIRDEVDYDSGKPGRVIVPINKEGKIPKPSIRLVVYIIDRADNQVKVAELPYSVSKQITALQQNPDYAFDDVPMPYDIRITYKKDAPPTEKYRVEVKPNGADLTQEQNLEFAKKFSEYSPEKVVQNKKDRQIDDDKRAGIWVSEDELESLKDDYNEKMVKTATIQAQDQETVKKVEYPEDIPF